jgi:capsular polysaccharide biosynthesis protein
MTGPSLPTIPTDGRTVTVEEAHAIGRQLADHPLLAARTDDEHPDVAEVLSDARTLLSTYGIGFEILRTRPGTVVMRARTDGRVSAQVACELVKSLVAAVAEQICGVRASLVENSCAQRGAAACLYSMVWEERPGDAQLAPPSPETLIDPGTVPPEPVQVSSTELPLPTWDRPAGQEAPAAALAPVEPTPFTPPARPAPEPSPPTAASSTAYRFQVSSPNAIVVPAVQNPAPAPPSAQPTPAAPAPVRSYENHRPGSVTARSRVPRGLIRRSWLMALALVAGSAGGWFAGHHAGTTYGAQATLVVQSGAGKSGPGSANDALALATTYSALIPKDQSILSTASSTLKMSTAAIERSLTVTVESGTSLLLLTFSSPTEQGAVKGADVVARAVASSTPLTAAIAAGSVAVVSVPNTASVQGTMHKYGIVIGAFLGIVIGLILVLAAERADPRVDDASGMATATGCRAAIIPADLSFAELAKVLVDAGREKGGLTIVPISVSDTAPTMDLARGLRSCWPPDGPAVTISPAFSSGVVELSRGSGPTVLVSHLGSRRREIAAATERLRMIGRPPVWAVLSNGRQHRRRSGRVG